MVQRRRYQVALKPIAAKLPGYFELTLLLNSFHGHFEIQLVRQNHALSHYVARALA